MKQMGITECGVLTGSPNGPLTGNPQPILSYPMVAKFSIGHKVFLVRGYGRYIFTSKGGQPRVPQTKRRPTVVDTFFS